MNLKYIALPLLFCFSTSIAGERLQGDALKEFWTGKTIIGVHHKLGPIKTYHAEDGQVRSKSSSGKERNGKWWIDDEASKKCIEWNNDGKQRCHFTEKNEDGTHTLIHGKKGKAIIEISNNPTGNQL